MKKIFMCILICSVFLVSLFALPAKAKQVMTENNIVIVQVDDEHAELKTQGLLGALISRIAYVIGIIFGIFFGGQTGGGTGDGDYCTLHPNDSKCKPSGGNQGACPNGMIEKGSNCYVKNYSNAYELDTMKNVGHGNCYCYAYATMNYINIGNYISGYTADGCKAESKKSKHQENRNLNNNLQKAFEMAINGYASVIAGDTTKSNGTPVHHVVTVIGITKEGYSKYKNNKLSSNESYKPYLIVFDNYDASTYLANGKIPYYSKDRYWKFDTWISYYK